MALFVVQHQHAAEVCPAGHPQYGPMLLKHLSKANAQAAGVRIEGEAVVNGKHTLYLIADGKDEETIRRFMAPFAQMGKVEVLPSNSCEVVVSRGRC